MKQIITNWRVLIVTLISSFLSILAVQTVALGQPKPEENKKPLVKQWKKHVIRQQRKGWEPFYGPRDVGLVKWKIQSK